MDVTGKTAIVTGAGAGIGAAIAERLVDSGAQVVVADLAADKVAGVAEGLNAKSLGVAVALEVDVSRTGGIEKMIATAQEAFGSVDLYFANAGIGGGVGLEASEEQWERAIDVNVMAHVRAAKLLVPDWLERGSGYFVTTASAAGLLTQIGSATYSVTKHAAVAFAEWLSVTYGDRGVAVSCLCPMGVNTDMLDHGSTSDNEIERKAARAVTDAGGVLEPDDVAAMVLAAVDAEQFLIAPHPEVLTMWQRKTSDYDRWLAGMRRYQESLV